MKKLIYSSLGKTEDSYYESLCTILEEHNRFKTGYKIRILSDLEEVVIKFMLENFQNSGEFPTEVYLAQVHPNTVGFFENAPTVAESDMRSHTFNVLRARIKAETSRRISELNLEVKSKGLTDEIFDEITRLKNLNDSNDDVDIRVDLDAREIYEEKKKRPGGMITGIKEVDDKIGGMNEGTVTTIAGFTSHFKSTWALNIAHLNAYNSGYNIAYISLETPKEDMNWNLLSRHSYEKKFMKFPYVGHDRMRKCLLTPDEESFIFNEVEKDLKDDFTDAQGNLRKRGRIVFLDESDFTNFSFTEIDSVLMKVDEKVPGGLDAVIVDYIQLCKFSGSGVTYDANAQINSYVTFFRRMGQSFGYGKNKKMISVILLSQINRGCWARAKNNEGRYDLTCLADANELERGSHRVMTTFTNEEMKGRNAAQVQILKNRNGATMYDPESVYAQGDAYVYKDEVDGANATFGGDSSMSVSAAMSGMDFDDLESLGI